MRASYRIVLLLLLGVSLFAAVALAASKTNHSSAVLPSRGLEAATAITSITGVAISPLLGTGAIGAWDWIRTPGPERGKLPWFSSPLFWIPALLLVTAIAVKDLAGAILPPGWKKPIDVAETIENKVSGFVAGAAVVPVMAAVFKSNAPSAAHDWSLPGLAMIQLGAVDFLPLLNVLTVPIGVAAFLFVWLVSHVIHVLILISPFGAVDAALKTLRTTLLSVLVGIHYINPWWGAVLSLAIVVISYFAAGWSFRMMVFGWLFTWDFVSLRRRRFQPDPKANWMFTGRKIEGTPIRSYGKLLRDDNGPLRFEYRPWLVMPKRSVTVPSGQYAVGRGLFYPELMTVEGEKTKSLFVMPPRYKKHEEAIGQVYGITEIVDTGILKGLKAIWRWWARNLFGVEEKPAVAAA